MMTTSRGRHVFVFVFVSGINVDAVNSNPSCQVSLFTPPYTAVGKELDGTVVSHSEVALAGWCKREGERLTGVGGGGI